MDAAEFLLEIRRRAPSDATSPDALVAARRFIDAQGNTGEGQALLRTLDALIEGKGTFSETEIWSLGRESLALASALIEARLAGKHAEWEWRRAASYPPWRFLLYLHKKYGL